MCFRLNFVNVRRKSKELQTIYTYILIIKQQIKRSTKQNNKIIQNNMLELSLSVGFNSHFPNRTVLFTGTAIHQSIPGSRSIPSLVGGLCQFPKDVGGALSQKPALRFSANLHTQLVNQWFVTVTVLLNCVQNSGNRKLGN